MPLLSLSDVSFSYHSLNGETKTLKNISFQVENGEFIAIVGPSGCGKSTLLSIIAGILKPETGTITAPDDLKIGYMLQKDLLLEWKTVLENCLLGLKFHKISPKEGRKRILCLLEQYGLYDFQNKKPSELSGGMRQRCALIRTIALDPDLLLLDESFSALDSQTRLFISSDISSIIRKNHKTAILVTHDPDEALCLADRVILLGKRPASIKKEWILSYPDRSDPIKLKSSKEFQAYHTSLWNALLES